MQDKDAGDFTISPEAPWYSHVQLRWHFIRKIVKAQSSLMAVDSLGSLSPIPGPKRPEHQVRTLTSWKTGEPIDSPMLTNPITDLNVVGMRVLCKAGNLGLLRCKEPPLALCEVVEVLCSRLAPFCHDTILQLI